MTAAPTAPTADLAEIADLIDLLGPTERRELEDCLHVLEQRPLPDLAYADDPVGWAVDVLGIPAATIRWSLNPGYARHVWDGTPDPLVALAEGLARGEDVGVESGTGTGKTFTVGWLVLWYAATRKPALVVTTAPKEDQLTLQLWKEVGGHWRRFKRAYPSVTTVKLRVRMDPDAPDDDLDAIADDAWAIVGYPCGVEANQESATRAQGFHSAHMLVVTEETPGVPKPVMTAFRNTTTGTRNVRLSVGNPDNQHDSLHEFCLEPGVRHVRISALDHPNVVTGEDVIPGAASPRSVARLADLYGTDSPMYESRVRGISPAQSADALIQWAWLEAAAERHAAGVRGTQAGPPALGVDVAQSEAGDKAALAFGRGARLVGVKGFACRNATQLGRDVHARMVRDGIDPWHVGVDPVGVGAATVNALDELTAPSPRRVQHLNGGAAPMAGIGRAANEAEQDWLPDANTFANLRAQMWWALREDLRTGRVDLPKDEALWRQLTLPTAVVKNGRTVVESKLDIRKRTGGKSPDEADAVVYWNWVRPRAAIPAKKVRAADRHPGFRETPGRRGVKPADEGLAAARERVFGAPPRVGAQRPASTVTRYGR